MKNRLELAELFRDKGFTVGAEIGVFDGYFSEHLLKTIPNLHLHAVDAWQVYNGYRDHKFQRNMDAAFVRAQERFAPFAGKVMITRKFSMDAVKGFGDGTLDFVYIDGNHEYKFVKEDIEQWTKKVRIGGIVAGDDYYLTPHGNVGVLKAVDEYVRNNNYILHITDWDMENPVEDNRQPSWFFARTH